MNNSKNKFNDTSSPTPPTAPVESSQNVGLPEPSACKAGAAFGAAPLLGDNIETLSYGMLNNKTFFISDGKTTISIPVTTAIYLKDYFSEMIEKYQIKLSPFDPQPLSDELLSSLSLENRSQPLPKNSQKSIQ